jgi:hypothetical protein
MSSFRPPPRVHAARRHPDEYTHCLPHLAKVICDPLYIGDDHKNPGIELIGWVPGVNSFVLVAVTVTKDNRGRYNVCSFYTDRKDKIDSRRQRGFVRVAVKPSPVRVATKAKGPP